MNDNIPPDFRSNRGPRLWTVLLVAPALVGVACVSAPEPEVTSDDIATVQERVEDVERTNGRLTVRVEQMERQMSLVQDRVESNRIALQRRGYLGGRGDRFARSPQQQREQPPAQAPESHYQQQPQQQRGDSSYRADPTMQQRMDSRGYVRVPLSDQQSGHRQQSHQVPRHQSGEMLEDPAGGELDYDAGSSDDSADTGADPLVITNETLEQRYGASTSSRSSSSRSSSSRSASRSGDSSSGDSGQQRQGTAYAPVTSERLPTSDELEYDPSEQAGSDDPDEAPAEESEVGVTDQSPVNQVDVDRWIDASDDELLGLYQEALTDYRNGEYGQALEGFTQFLEAGPRDDYVDNALYWIGECHYGLGDYQASVDYFDQIIEQLSSAGKVPDAMLKKSLAYDRMGRSAEAVELLEVLIEEYPNSNPGRLGKERLEELGYGDS